MIKSLSINLKEVEIQMQGRKIIIIGAGSLGVMTLDAILSQGNYNENDIFFMDDSLEENQKIEGFKVIGGIESIANLNLEEYDFIIAIANNQVRKNIAEAHENLTYTNVIHPDATVSSLAIIGKGNIILPNTSIDPNVIIKDHVIINKNSSIGHDSMLEDFSQISPGCSLGGFTRIGNGVFLGLGTNTLPEIQIGNNTVIGAGSTVTKDITDNCTGVGSPCKIIKYHEVNRK